MLRGELLNETKKALTRNPRFRVEDFVIDKESAETQNRLLITCRFDPKFMFRAEISNKAESYGSGLKYEIVGVVCLGEFTVNEEVAFSSKSQLLTGISSWVDRIDSELRAIPVFCRVEERTRELQDILKKYEDLPDEYLSQEEAEKLRQKLDELERQLTETLERSITDKKELNAKLNALHIDMETLKQNIGSLKKRGWVSSLGVRAANWTKDPENRELLKSGSEVAKLLLEASKNYPSQ